MHRFFLPSELFQSSEIILPAEVSQQISRVLRLRSGSEILLLDDRGAEYPARLCEINEFHSTVTVLSKRGAQGEPATRLTLVVALTQREKFELILQKCTEIGISSILPVITSRTLVQKTLDVEDKTPRWKKIMLEAAEQSHRGRVPRLLPAAKYVDALSSLQHQEALKLILWEAESDKDIKPVLQGYQGHDVAMIVGPEGGLSIEEVEAAKKLRYIPVSLGRRILRMETAAILATGLVFYELG